MTQARHWSFSRAIVAVVLAVAAVRSYAGDIAYDPASAPAVAAEFRSTLVEAKDAQPKTTSWRFWRDGDRVVRETPARERGELWQRDGNTTFLTRLYHADRKGIEYRSDDLEILNATPEWQQVAFLVGPDVLHELSTTPTRLENGVPVQRWSGEIDGTHWDVALRTDLMLPTQVVRTIGPRVERLDLVEGTVVAQAPWQPTPIDGYELIDHADLGDRERDPFVVRISAEEGYEPGYGNGHAH